jgi:hypothetical protein
MFADESKRRQLSVTGRKNALEFFSVKRAAQEVMNLIAELR